MKPEELARLRAIAEAATPGEWRVPEDNNLFADGRHVFASGFDGSDFVVANLKTDQTFVTATSRQAQQTNAAHIAAFSPAPAKRLLDHIARLEDALREARRTFAGIALHSEDCLSHRMEIIDEAARHGVTKIDAALGEGV